MSPARLSLILACSLTTAAVPASAQIQPTVTVILDSYRFAPNPIRLAAGQPVRLYLYNQSSRRHNFNARSFFGNARILAGSAPDGTVELRGRQGATVDLIPAAGRYGVYCSLFFHKQLGMKAVIVVE